MWLLTFLRGINKRTRIRGRVTMQNCLSYLFDLRAFRYANTPHSNNGTREGSQEACTKAGATMRGVVTRTSERTAICEVVFASTDALQLHIAAFLR